LPVCGGAEVVVGAAESCPVLRKNILCSGVDRDQTTLQVLERVRRRLQSYASPAFGDASPLFLSSFKNKDSAESSPVQLHRS
jgi:hypothetical protein